MLWRVSRRRVCAVEAIVASELGGVAMVRGCMSGCSIERLVVVGAGWWVGGDHGRSVCFKMHVYCCYCSDIVVK